MTPRSLVSQQTCNTQLRVRGRHRGPAWGHRHEYVDMSSPQVRLAQETDRIHVMKPSLGVMSTPANACAICFGNRGRGTIKTGRETRPWLGRESARKQCWGYILTGEETFLGRRWFLISCSRGGQTASGTSPRMRCKWQGFCSTRSSPFKPEAREAGDGTSKGAGPEQLRC